ncbi:MAG TPA: DinB family protein [Longimicrobium sp.]|nr:DinB family protein [Longimicrobium sp.]
MTEIDRIADQLERAYDGDAWYGSPTLEVLRGVTPAQAAHRPIPEAHTVWEIVLHMTSWMREVARRVRDGVAREPVGGDWPPVPEPTEENWRYSIAALEEAFGELLAEVRAFPAERLDEVVGDARERPLGSGVSYYVLLHGIVQHNLAHTAQMALLRKAFPPG